MRIATLESRICKPNGKPQIEHSNPVSSKRQLMQTQRNSTFRASRFHLFALEHTKLQSSHLLIHPLSAPPNTHTCSLASNDTILNEGLQIEQMNFRNSNFHNTPQAPIS